MATCLIVLGKEAGFHPPIKADLRKAIKLLMVAVPVFPNPAGVACV
jgi:hypothetical protein